MSKMKKTFITLILMVMMSIFMTSCSTYEEVSYETRPKVSIIEVNNSSDDTFKFYYIYDTYDWYHGFYIYNVLWCTPFYINCYYYPYYWNYYPYYWRYWRYPYDYTWYWHHGPHHGPHYRPHHFNNPLPPRHSFQASVRHTPNNTNGSMGGRRPTINNRPINRPINISRPTNVSRPTNTNRPTNVSRPIRTSTPRPANNNIRSSTYRQSSTPVRSSNTIRANSSRPSGGYRPSGGGVRPSTSRSSISSGSRSLGGGRR